MAFPGAHRTAGRRRRQQQRNFNACNTLGQPLGLARSLARRPFSARRYPAAKGKEHGPVDIPRAPAKKRKRYIYIGAGIAAVVLTTVALTRLEPAAPTVDRAVVFPDTVKRGPMIRQVRGTGTLVPEEIRWITAVTQGRVEEKLVEPGAQVDENTVLLRLSNPDVELQALEADRQLNSAELELVNLRASLETQRLSQEATVASVQAQYNEAMRQYEAQKELAERGLVAEHELARARDGAEETARRLEIEKQRLE